MSHGRQVSPIAAGGEPWPAAAAVAALLACGATGYGLSLRLYLVAQRRVGVRRGHDDGHHDHVHSPPVAPSRAPAPVSCDKH